MRRPPVWIAGITIAGCLLSIVLRTIPAAALQPSTHRTLDRTGPITYFIAEGTGQIGFRPGDRQLALWALEAIVHTGTQSGSEQDVVAAIERGKRRSQHALSDC